MICKTSGVKPTSEATAQRFVAYRLYGCSLEPTRAAAFTSTHTPQVQTFRFDAAAFNLYQVNDALRTPSRIASSSVRLTFVIRRGSSNETASQSFTVKLGAQYAVKLGTQYAAYGATAV